MSKERPILFSGEMVRAILSGRKTQTRRVVKFNKPIEDHRAWKNVYPHPISGFIFTDGPCSNGLLEKMAHGREGKISTYGVPGDRLWVRETFSKSRANFEGGHKGATWTARNGAIGDILYRANEYGNDYAHKWTPSIFMPRWACRIVLEIVSVRVERLQDISRGDAMDEGCPFPNMEQGDDPRNWYAHLWDSINGKKYPWSSNHWVWVIEFKRIA